ncbi:MAG: MBL fold metallo-hydrolase [Thermofilaceae archaeon]|nr:MBL fold metallo-hydrolase [Thermofilaceae archaeon]
MESSPQQPSPLSFVYFGGACIVVEVQGYSLVFDPADHMTDSDITALTGSVITLFTHYLDDHFHERTAMKLVEMKSSLIVGTEEVYKALVNFAPSTKLLELKPRRGFRAGPLRIYALEGRHDVPTNLYYVTWGPSLLFAGDTGYVDLSKLKADLAFLPAGGSLFSNPQDSMRMAMDVGARYVVPIHCEHGEARRLAELLEGRVTVLLPALRMTYKLSL